MFAIVITWLEATAASVPLPLFAIVGSIVEEIVAPIPSPLVATLAGSIAASQKLTLLSLVGICIIAAAGKTAGAWIFYQLAVVFEHALVPRFGKYIGVTQQDLERYGKHLNGSKRDLIVLTIIRAIPVMPSTPISVLCGFVNSGLRVFLISTFCGFFIRTAFFMYIGFTGLSAIDELMSGMDTAETILKAAIVLIILVVLAWLYWRREAKT